MIIAGPHRAVSRASDLSQRPQVLYPIRPHTLFSPSADSRRAVVSYWRKYVLEVLVNRLEGLNLPRNSMVRITDHPDMAMVVYYGRKQQYNSKSW